VVNSSSLPKNVAKPELLAPAGDWESLRAAVAGGADAVYFGLSNFNARHRATNFSADELPQVMDYLHRRNVRGYVALNTLIFSDELAEVARLVAVIAAAGADAVIVQDLGLARLVHRLAPELPIHGSTQMTLTEARGIEFVRCLGIERVILARELSLDDIRGITARTDMPLEVFVHGALCIAYSGQCLTSEALGGRSANRGQCAQACRLPYELIVDGKVQELGEKAYLLSPQDLAAYDLIEPLVKLGVQCFKIEGRLKSPQYVAVASQTYRAAIDAATAQQPFTLPHQQQLDLQQSFSRGFSPGFLSGVNHQRLVEGRFPKSRGVRLGNVVQRATDRIVIELAAEHIATREADLPVKPGDGIVLDEGHPEQDEQGGRVFGVLSYGDRRVELTFGRGQVNTAALAPTTIVWKTDDPALRKRTEQLTAREDCVRRVPLDFHLSGTIAGPLELSIRDPSGRNVSAAWAGPLEVARRPSFTPEVAREQFGRLGDTPFELGEVRIEVSADAMVPKSVLNQLRREAVEQLISERLMIRRAPIRPQDIPAILEELRGATSALPWRDDIALDSPRLYVLVRTQEQLEAIANWRPAAPLARPALVYCDFEDVRRYAQAVALAHAAEQPIGLATLRILKPGEEGLLARVAQAGADAVLVRNLGALAYFQDRAPRTPWIGDFSLNVSNELTAALFFDRNPQRLVPSYDLNWEQLAAMLKRCEPSHFEVVIHQHMPMFHMEHCVFAALLSNGKDWRDCGRPCDTHQVALRDRVGAEFPLTADTGCRNTVFNSVAQSAAEFVPRMLSLGVRHFRVELLRESAADALALVDRYARVLAGVETSRNTWRQLQVLNQLGVTRGTLQH
jgi:U32 family peptidase